MTASMSTVKGPRTASSQQFLTTFAGIFALIGAFLALDLSLARIDRSENRQHAANLFRDGKVLLSAGRPADAADRLANAVSLDRNNTEYGVALAQAMMASRRYADAERLLEVLLDRSPNDASVSLTMARLLASTGRSNDAKVFYHRAIFGRWPSDSTKQRMNARFELIDLLAQQNSREELLAELLPLQSLADDSTMLLRKVAPLFIQAGSPKRAIEEYRALLRRTPGDLAAYAGIGEAYIALGEFRDARESYLSAVRINPANAVALSRLSAIDAALMLDPNARGISDAERMRRSQALLQRTLAFVDACSRGTTSPRVSSMRDSAEALLGTAKAQPFNASKLEARISISQSLWSVQTNNCETTDADALRLVQQLLAR